METLIKTTTGQWMLKRGDKLTPVLSQSSVSAAPNLTTKKPEDIEQLLGSIKLPNLSPQARQRLREAVRLYRKGVRNLIDTYSVLQRSEDTGGVALSALEAEAVIKIISIQSAEAPQKKSLATASNHAQKFAAAVAQKQDTSLQATVPTPSATVRGGQFVTDVKNLPRVVGPIEELRLMTLKDWRRLDINPTKAMQIIKHKLTLLQEESFAEYAAGVVAWRQSAVAQKYMQLIDESLHSGQPLSEVVAAARVRDNNSLTWAEFVALRDFSMNLH